MKSIWITSILGLSVLVAGCATANKGAPRPNVNQQQIKVQQTAPQDKASLNNAQIATRLEQIAKSNPNVQKARCVVFGRTAIVGIDIKEDMKRSQVGSVKFSVAEALKKIRTELTLLLQQMPM
ncbi:YhcN/YlaJ family sporulation lipoprotein [Paenibacillus larvae]|nr:YhcN/YlaJ family sporulation lipoprotein [Paenibacillus larvae]MDT2241272.1 YhcN/YlaJ family sporulation lipoprotein [Paenibacillus larvae]